MDIGNALRQLVGAPHLFAVRTRGPILNLTDSQRVQDCRTGRPARYVPKFSDLVAIDWEVMTAAKLRAHVEAANAGLRVAG